MMFTYPQIVPLRAKLVLAGQWDESVVTSGVIDNMVAFIEGIADRRNSFLFKFFYSGREGLFFFINGVVTAIASPHGFEDYFEFIYENGTIYIKELTESTTTCRYKRL